MKEILFPKFSRRITVDVYPSQFIFNSAHNDLNFSIATFVYLDNSKSKSSLFSLGDEVKKEHITDHIHRVNIFEIDVPLPPKTTLTRSDLYQTIFAYGLGRCYEDTIIPRLRPIVFILGVDRFSNLFEDPKDEFVKAAKGGGAGMIVLDSTEL